MSYLYCLQRSVVIRNMIRGMAMDPFSCCNRGFVYAAEDWVSYAILEVSIKERLALVQCEVVRGFFLDFIQLCKESGAVTHA